jgi:hypothetical protein
MIKKIFKVIMTNLEARSPNVVVVSEVVPHLSDGDMWPRDTHDSDQGELQGLLLGIDLIRAMDHTQVDQRATLRHPDRPMSVVVGHRRGC